MSHSESKKHGESKKHESEKPPYFKPLCRKSALELLELGNSDRENSWLHKYWAPVLGIPFGFLSGMAINQGRRPPLASIHNHIVFSIGWTALVAWAMQYQASYAAEKDAVLRHYVMLHPEDFPLKRSRKIGEVFEEWVPVR